MSEITLTRSVGQALDRVDGPQKVTGTATYALEHDIPETTYLAAVQSTIAKGRISAIDAAPVLEIPGVLAVVTHENAPRLAPVKGIGEPTAELAVLQQDRVSYRGQIVAAVVAETLEVARQAAAELDVRYEAESHDVRFSDDRDDLEVPALAFPITPGAVEKGDVDGALASAAVLVDSVYSTPVTHHNTMETHSTLALWDGDTVTLYDSSQGAHSVRAGLAQAFELPPDDIRVVSRFVGGAFGSKSWLLPPALLTVLAAKVVQRPVHHFLTRQQMFSLAGYRSPTIQRIRLGADADGRLLALEHDAVVQTSVVHDFIEPAAVASLSMYDIANRRTRHRVARLNVPTPCPMRAPGHTPGSFALESAVDELAVACGVDPIDIRLMNEPQVSQELGYPFSSRKLVECLQDGAARFGWESGRRRPGGRRDGRWLIGTGVAVAEFPSIQMPGEARINALPGSSTRYEVLIDATDVGTGALTALSQVAADWLEAPLDAIELRIGDSTLPQAPNSAGSWGMSSWGSAIASTAADLRRVLAEEHGGVVPPEGLSVKGGVQFNLASGEYSMAAHGAQFAEVAVDVDTGEIKVTRMLGAFAAGTIINPKLARSQIIGGMTMGIGMALLEGSEIDLHAGHYLNNDLANYHVAANADVPAIEVLFIDEDDPHVNMIGAKGIGEVGMVGAAAAIANAVFDATGRRTRHLPIRLDELVGTEIGAALGDAV